MWIISLIDSRKNTYIMCNSESVVTGYSSCDEATQFIKQFTKFNFNSALFHIFDMHYSPMLTEIKNKEELQTYVGPLFKTYALKRGKDICYGLYMGRKKGKDFRGQSRSRKLQYGN